MAEKEKKNIITITGGMGPDAKPDDKIEISMEVIDDSEGKPSKYAAFWRVVKVLCFLSLLVSVYGWVSDHIRLHAVSLVVFSVTFLAIVARHFGNGGGLGFGPWWRWYC